MRRPNHALFLEKDAQTAAGSERSHEVGPTGPVGVRCGVAKEPHPTYAELFQASPEGGDPAAGSPTATFVTTSPQSLTLPWSAASLRLAYRFG